MNLSARDGELVLVAGCFQPIQTLLIFPQAQVHESETRGWNISGFGHAVELFQAVVGLFGSPRQRQRLAERADNVGNVPGQRPSVFEDGNCLVITAKKV